MQTYLELEGKDGNQVPTDLAKPLHHRRPQIPKGQLTKRREPKHP